MGIFDKLEYFWGTNNPKNPHHKPKDPNSNSALRGYERRLANLKVMELTPRRLKEMKKLEQKIINQKEKIRKRNEKIHSS